METVAFIIPYFGKLHDYFTLFLHSCSLNQSVDFIFVSDIEDFPALPLNCKRLDMSFGELAQKIEKRLGFDVELTNIYKIVDFKPMWGDIFQDELKEYDFWGFCDCDMILGDLRGFFGQIEFCRYDKIFCHGHMTILRNDDLSRSLYKTKGGFEREGVFNYEEAFRTKCVVYFDEGGGFTEICRYLGVRSYESVIYADVSFQRRRFTLAQPIPTALYPCIFTFEHGDLKRVVYENGQIISYPILYVHLQKRTMEVHITSNIDKYQIIPNAFVDDREISAGYILENARDGLYWNECKRKIKNLAMRLSPERLRITFRNKRIRRMKNWDT